MNFRGELRFLSNFYLLPTKFEGITYPSVENAYQASKTLDEGTRFAMSEMLPGESKRAGRRLKLRADWFAVRHAVMRQLVTQKFQDPYLKKKLQGVKGEIVEHNVWHDNFWGSCTCPKCGDKGGNHLGKLLMEVRDEG